MNAPDNIDRFNRMALLTLEKLYSAFPVPVDVDVAKLAMDTLPEDASFDESFDSIEPAFYAVQFLADEGFVTHKGSYVDGRTFLKAQLTTRGLTVLGAVPAALEYREPLIEKIRGAVKGGIRQAGSEVVKQLATSLFSFGTSAAQTWASSGAGS